jgi:hypothetical protein
LQLAEDAPAPVGVDHGFSLPLHYFEVHGLLLDWPAFLDEFQHHWPTDDDNTYIEFVRDGGPSRRRQPVQYRHVNSVQDERVTN